MLSYQHIYHAGCLADMHKHAVLCLMLNKMVEKAKPLTYIETHAGRGIYDLTAPECQKTGEAAAGILQYVQAGYPNMAVDHPYRRALSDVHRQYGTQFYPGSPLFADYFMRSGDVMHCAELHPQEFKHLQENMMAAKEHGHTGAHLYKQDGLHRLIKLSPPPSSQPRRGLVMIDPSYEIKAEYGQMADVIGQVMRKWPVAVIALWYPILAAGHHHDMLAQIKSLTPPKLFIHEMRFDAQEHGKDYSIKDSAARDSSNRDSSIKDSSGKNEPKKFRGMHGSGMVIINTPFGIDANIKALSFL